MRGFLIKALLSGIPGSPGVEGWVVQSEFVLPSLLASWAYLQFKVMVTRDQACTLMSKFCLYSTQGPPVLS